MGFKVTPQFDGGLGLQQRWQGIYRGEVFVTKSGTLLRSWRDDPGLLAKNGIPNAAIEDNQAVYFNSGLQKTAWFMGVINNAPPPTLAPTDTMSAHAGWVELASYTEAARPQWVPGAPAAKVITNPVSVAFSINATVSIYGAFLVSNSTKSGTAGILWSTGAFNTLQSLVNGQSFRISYTLTGAAS